MNEVAKTSGTGVTEYKQAPVGNETILKGDILLPKLLLMQGLSDFVSERKKDPNTGAAIAQGDMVRSLTGEIVGGPDKPVEVIPLTYVNQWVVMEKMGSKFEYRKTLTRDHGPNDNQLRDPDRTSENLPWEFSYEGTDWKRVKSLGLFGLVASDVAAFQAELDSAKAKGEIPDFNKTIMPIVINFRSTGFNAGKKVVTHFAKAASMAQYGAVAYAYTLQLSCYQDKNDLGSYYVFDVAQGRKCTPIELGEAKNWYSRVTTEAVKVDESDEVVSERGNTSKTPAPTDQF